MASIDFSKIDVFSFKSVQNCPCNLAETKKICMCNLSISYKIYKKYIVINLSKYFIIIVDNSLTTQ